MNVLSEVCSSSNPGKKYQICEGDDGVIYCTCTAWKMSKERPKTCKHLKAFMSQATREALMSKAKEYNEDGDEGCHDDKHTLKQVIAAEIAKLTSR